MNLMIASVDQWWCAAIGDPRLTASNSGDGQIGQLRRRPRRRQMPLAWVKNSSNYRGLRHFGDGNDLRRCQDELTTTDGPRLVPVTSAPAIVMAKA